MSVYSESFSALTGRKTIHPYQEEVAERLFEGRHLVVRAPTGGGKTLAVLAPYLIGRDRIGVRTLIYVLPLRTLVEAVFQETCELAKPRGLKVAIQTGERADAEFFHNADIIVTTFDQLLSGLLCEPYGLAAKLWNINAAAMAGKLVVFDEFHLMYPAKAFLTALMGAEMFKGLFVSVWMTATATSPLTNQIRSMLNAVEIELSPAEQTALFEGRGISRGLRTHWGEFLTAAEVMKFPEQQVLVVVNTVGRAQRLFGELEDAGVSALLLHSRFFSNDRSAKQKTLKDGKNRPRVVVATQVIEAGVDISSEVLLTELAPVNALVQRAGRCARFKGESGFVHVYNVPNSLPYDQDDLSNAKSTVTDTDLLSPATCAAWVETAHGAADQSAARDFTKGIDRRRALIKGHVTGDGPRGAAEYIRGGGDAVRVFVLDNPVGEKVKPSERQAISMRRQTVRQFQKQAWVREDESWTPGGDIALAYAVALPRSIAGYTYERGLVLGTSGNIESPAKIAVERPGYGALKAEPWAKHTLGVIDESLRRLQIEGLGAKYKDLVVWAARLHDLGKLQDCWQRWAWERQSSPGSEVTVALAHTDYDWRRDRGEPRPPWHAAGSALYGECYLAGMTDYERSAVLLTVLAHHGGTLAGGQKADKLHSSAGEALRLAEFPSTKPTKTVDLYETLRDDVNENFSEVWPLTAVLSRILRLSDQKATSDAGNG